MAVSEPPRVAPTVKVLDDAPYPPQVAAPGIPYAPGPASVPPSISRAQTPMVIPSRAPTPVPVAQRVPTPAPLPSRPPTNVPQGSIPPGASARPGRAQSPAMSAPGLSMPLVQRPWGLISLVILIDLALAGTGAVLLAKGLSGRSGGSGSPTSGPASGSATTAPAPAPAAAPAPPAPPPASAPAAGSGSAAPHAEVEPAGSPIATVAAKVPPVKHHTTTTKTTGPVDPYTPDLATEVELMASRSQPQFTKCYGEADKATPVHGKIEVAFQVMPNGHVSNAQPVINTTGSAQLASCLTSTMLHWTFAAKPATATDFVRPFTYP